MKQTLNIYLKLAESLAHLFAPMAQVGLYDAQDQLLGIFNQWTADRLEGLSSHQVITLTVAKNKHAKAMQIPLSDGYQMQVVLETTLFETLQTYLTQYLQKEPAKNEGLSWQQQVDQSIQNFAHDHHKSVALLSVQDKRALILILKNQGLLQYKDATNYLATQLDVSRATIYNYLNEANQLGSLQVHQVDAFTDEPFSGNPAGVVLDADSLSDNLMKKITREMNLSETSFVLTSNKADIKLRYFTPSGAEVKFCGHSTVGALYMLAHKKMFGMDKPGNYAISVETKVGILSAGISLTENKINIQFQTPKVVLVKSKITHADIATSLGIPLDTIVVHIPIMFEKTNKDLYITIHSLKALGSLQIDQRSAKQFAEKHGIVAYVLLCHETISKNSHIHMRCFAPAVGIPEDPFTGSVLGGLAAYITQFELIDKRVELIRVEQGHFISRPGFVDIKLNAKHPNASPTVLASARHFFSTQINL